MKRLTRGIDPLVFWGSVGAATAFVLWGVLATDGLATVMGDVLDWVIRNFGWGFVLIAIGALVFCIVAAFSPVGRIRLGPDDSRPDFGSQNAVMVVDAGKLERVGADRFMQVVDAVNRRLTNGAIVDMNRAVTEGQDDGEVAERFLRDVGLLRPIDLDDS